jgi:stage V sporulation protein B
MTKKTFFYGAVILTAAGILAKLLGALFRIPLNNLIGAPGMAYYQAVYPIYVLLLTFSTAGFPVAISRMVSERLTFGDHYGAHRVFRISLTIMAILGAASFLVMWFIAEPLSQSLSNLEGAVYGMRAIAPALLFVAVTSAYKGYFQGMRNMRPTAAVQITEQLFRVTVGLTLAFMLVSKGKEFAAAGATFGATAGSFAGLILILLVYFRKVRKPEFREELASSRRTFMGSEQSLAGVLRALFMIMIPITIGASIMPIMNNIDLAIVSNRLANSGWNPDQVRSMYGQLTSFAGAIKDMPQFMTQSIAISLVPTIISAYKTRDENFLSQNVTLSMRMTVLVSLPCAVGIFTLSEPILKLLYFRQIDDAIAAAPSLRILAVGIVFIAVIQTMTGILQGVERQWRPMINLLAGAVVKVILTYTLTGIKSVNILGAATGTVVAYFVAATLNYHAMKKFTNTNIEWKLVLIRPVISAAVMGGCAYGAYRLCLIATGNSIATLAGVFVGGVVYLVMIFAVGAIRRDELSTLPKGKALVKAYDKVFFMKKY